jgi:hypothetical protein
MKKEIQIGTVYENKWAEERLPVIMVGDRVCFLQKAYNEIDWLFHPSDGSVTITEFNKKWTPTTRSTKDLEVCRQAMVQAQKDWLNLIENNLEMLKGVTVDNSKTN